jgi:signal peptidase I
VAEPLTTEWSRASESPPLYDRPLGQRHFRRRKRSTRRTVVEWAAILVAALVVALLVKTFLVQAFYIPSGSMEPTLKPGDRVLVDKLSYDLHGVHRGDIVVFSRPPNDADSSVKDLIKRVIGLPGDTIWSGANGSIFIDGKLLNQPWLTAEAKANPGPAVPRTVLPKNDYYVMGDNRGDSSDSRVIGPISGNLIVGRAFVRVWPLTSVTFF